jgi:hypothetical protein
MRARPSTSWLLVHRFIDICSAVEAPRAQWQGATREHSLSPYATEEQRRQWARAASTLRAGVLFGSYRVAQSSRIASDMLLLRSLSEPKITPGRVADISETVH